MKKTIQKYESLAKSFSDDRPSGKSRHYVVFFMYYLKTRCVGISNFILMLFQRTFPTQTLFGLVTQIFLPYEGEEDCVTSPKRVCLGGYNPRQKTLVYLDQKARKTADKVFWKQCLLASLESATPFPPTML